MQGNDQNPNIPQNSNAIPGNSDQINLTSALPLSGKEQEAISVKAAPRDGESKTVPEISFSAPSEVSIPPELKSFVEKGPDASETVIQKISAVETQQKKPAGDSVLNTAFGRLKLPMSYQNALGVFKKTGTSDSMHWLASLVMYQWLKYSPETINNTGQPVPQS